MKTPGSTAQRAPQLPREHVVKLRVSAAGQGSSPEHPSQQWARGLLRRGQEQQTGTHSPRPEEHDHTDIPAGRPRFLKRSVLLQNQVQRQLKLSCITA